MLLVHAVTTHINFHKPYFERFRFLNSHGFKIIAVSSPGDSAFYECAKNSGISTYSIPFTRRIDPRIDIFSFLHLCSFLLQRRPTIVHCQSPKAGILGMVASWITRIPIRVLSMYGLPPNSENKLVSGILLSSTKLACRLATRVLCDGKVLRRVLVANGYCRPGKIKVLHNGSANGVDARQLFNPDRFSNQYRRAMRRQWKIALDATVIGFLGRIVPDKGVLELIQAWQKLRSHFNKLHLLVVGPFEDEHPLPKELRILFKSDPRIHLTGYVPIEETPKLYSVMDIIALPSYREGFSAVPIEAGAMRLPVVVTNVPGAADIVEHNATGIVVPPHDAKALARAIRHLITNPTIRQQMGDEARRRVVRDFCPQDIWEALAKEYYLLARNQGLLGS